jgi:hypothetical protein
VNRGRGPTLIYAAAFGSVLAGAFALLLGLVSDDGIAAICAALVASLGALLLLWIGIARSGVTSSER